MSATSTQELIYTAVQSALENTDVVAKLYLKLRQDALEIYTTIQKELARDGAASVESQLKLEQLRFEKDKLSVEYAAHVDRIVSELQFEDKSSTSALDKINQDYDRLLAEKTSVADEIQRLQNIQGPVLEKMHLLVGSYNRILSGKNTTENKGKQEVQISKDIYTFTSDNLKDAVAGMRSKLLHLSAEKALSLRQMLDIDVNGHLERFLESGTGFTLLEDDSYIYKKDENPAKDLGDGSVPVSELEQTLEGLEVELIALVEETQQSKQSWEKNAKILELLRFLDEDTMDVDL